MKIPKYGDLKIYHIPNIPGKPFEQKVKSIKEAMLLLNTIADYDLFLLANNHRSDYANVGGLLCYNGKEWEEWVDNDGSDINDLIKENR